MTSESAELYLFIASPQSDAFAGEMPAIRKVNAVTASVSLTAHFRITLLRPHDTDHVLALQRLF